MQTRLAARRHPPPRTERPRPEPGPRPRRPPNAANPTRRVEAVRPPREPFPGPARDRGRRGRSPGPRTSPRDACATGSSRAPAAARAGRSPAGVRLALARPPIEADSLRQPGEELERQLDVALDHPPHQQLVGHREVNANLVEQRAGRAREVAAVIREPPDHALARVEDLLLVPATGLVDRVLDYSRGQLAVDGATEPIHLSTPGSIPFPSLQAVLAAGAHLEAPRVCQRRMNPKGLCVKGFLIDRSRQRSYDRMKHRSFVQVAAIPTARVDSSLPSV
jgi:hypothetical protein